MAAMIMKELMGFHEELQVILKNSLHFLNMSTYKLLIFLIQCISERMWLKHYGEYWMEGETKKKLSKFAMTFKKPTVQ